MELKEAIEKRTSIRSFTKEEVSLDDLKEMVRRAGLAPSANNFQPWRFILISSKEKLKEMALTISKAYELLDFKKSKASENLRKQVEWYSTFFTEAPVMLALIMNNYETVLEKGTNLSHEEINEMRNYPDIQSTGACIQNILLSAVEMNYGACWLSGPMIAKDEISKLLNLKEDEKLSSFVVIGRTNKEFKSKGKENLADTMEVIS